LNDVPAMKSWNAPPGMVAISLLLRDHVARQNKADLQHSRWRPYRYAGAD
jgi:hypothetical protein